uniref:Uncharacterized protein n=1 Tax=Catharus ustulatus TaxID=91951 RepID=A0A8C3U7T1_CATUS
MTPPNPLPPPPLQLCVLSVTDEGAALDGGDVLFTVQEFFVGISPWTNLRGAKAVADAFRDFTVSMVPVGHLKGFLSMADPQTIAHSCSHGARRALRPKKHRDPRIPPKIPMRPPKGPPKNSMTPLKGTAPKNPPEILKNLLRDPQNSPETPQGDPKKLNETPEQALKFSREPKNP